jgi:hypothetical protein
VFLFVSVFQKTLNSFNGEVKIRLLPLEGQGVVTVPEQWFENSHFNKFDGLLKLIFKKDHVRPATHSFIYEDRHYVF